MNGAQQRFEQLLECIGAPLCRGERYALYQGDCLDLLPQIPHESIDLTVTSPPYNIGKEYERPLPLAEYVDWCARWMHEVHRIAAPHGAFWLNLGYVGVAQRGKAVPLPYLIWDRCPFFLVQEVVWNYGAGVSARHSLSPRNEKFLWYVKDEHQYTFNLDDIRDPDVKYPHQKKNGRLRCNTVGKNPSDVWQIAKVTSGTDRASEERAPHPAQFPLDLIDRIVRGCSQKDDFVLDPFMGSGTTAESGVLQGRFVIGFEIRDEYCAYARQRLRRAVQRAKSVLFER
jgi:adenine-specific DNA-methyltransferase